MWTAANGVLPGSSISDLPGRARISVAWMARDLLLSRSLSVLVAAFGAGALLLERPNTIRCRATFEPVRRGASRD